MERNATQRILLQRITLITLTVLSCAALSTFWSIASAEDRSTPPLAPMSLTHLEDSTAPQHDKLAPIAVQQFAHQHALALGSVDGESNWKKAELSFTPLGPGTHSWLVQATFEEKLIGYMIITATDQGHLKLSEYGLGEQSPYDRELLSHALERQHLNLTMIHADGGKLGLRYALPLLAYWKVERPNQEALYIDATNGDLLPSETLRQIETTSKPMVMIDTYASATSSWLIDSVHMRPTFNPMDNLLWITSKPVKLTRVQDWTQLHKELGIVYSANNRNIFYGGPLPISGYQLWHNKAQSQSVFYVAIGGHTSTQRFVPLDTLLEDGQFYVANP
ncbi:hypothetical protein ASD24_11895 [Paenibacillus sp. Root52]|uniref:hypothetical protein n=1 Tax=Paenibacillus sp. Root52 TaxID=1736552 RepID=UPI0006FB669C|nr:hypothetical protein [Paenibacillus sp. Root52]KQY82992.1 hypothetical protein ASD24_11895 [Paenibacillus sp. Root52]